MGVVKEIKDTARKTTNKITDTIENIVEKPKSPKELASRLVEHLSHQEYNKIAKIITEETRKYASKLGLEDLKPVNDKLDQFESKMNDLATDFEEGNYQEVVAKLKTVAQAFPDQTGKGTEVFKPIKSFLNSIIKLMEEYIQNAKKDLTKEGPDYSKLKSIFEESFNALINNKLNIN